MSLICRRFFALTLSLAVGSSAAASAQCSPEWLPAVGAFHGVNGIIYGSIVFDDGSGPALYVGGRFTRADGVVAENVARYDGNEWTSMGLGLRGSAVGSRVRTFAVYDNGTGPALYAGGNLRVNGNQVAGVARWTGSNWERTTASQQVFGEVQDLEVFDDGAGPALFASGDLRMLQTMPPSSAIGRYDAMGWTGLSIGLEFSNGSAANAPAMQTFDDGSGPALYVGGDFDQVMTPGGLVGAQGLAIWQQGRWSVPAQELSLPVSFGAWVKDLALYDFGAGDELVVAGDFTSAGGSPARSLAAWNGSTWRTAGLGVDGPVSPQVDQLAVYPASTGSELWIQGRFEEVGSNTSAMGLAKLNSLGWTDSGEIIKRRQSDTPGALTTYDLGAGPQLLLSGNYDGVGEPSGRWSTAWDGAEWGQFPKASEGPNGSVRASVFHDDGSGAKLYMGGAFRVVDDRPMDAVARREGGEWVSVGSGIPGVVVIDLVSMQTPQGPRLYAGGYRRNITGGSWVAESLEVWEFDGVDWHILPVPTALWPGIPSLVDMDLEVYRSQGEFKLYVASQFGIIEWNGQAWSRTGGVQATTVNGFFYSLGVHDDGSGEKLVASGHFEGITTGTGTTVIGRVVAWDGVQWNSMDPGFFPSNTRIDELHSVEIAGTSQLIATGFVRFGALSDQDHVASWNGSIWTLLPSRPRGSNVVVSSTGFDLDGTGEQLVIAHRSSVDEGAELLHFDGVSWHSLGTSEGGPYQDLRAHQDDGGSGEVLFALGDFTQLGDQPAAFLARYGGCADGLLGTSFCESAVNSTGQAARTTASGSPLASENRFTITAIDLPVASPGFFIASTSEGFVIGPAGSQGNLCLAGSIGRFNANALSADARGTFSLMVDLSTIPQPMGAVAVMAGETWSFQAWYRDANPLQASNFSQGLRVNFR